MRRILFSIILGLMMLPIMANEIDQYFMAKNQHFLACTDEVFVRRSYLTLTGRLPQSDQVLAFIQSTDPHKRENLIDELLNTDAYVKYMVMRWGDILRIKSEFPSNLWPNGVQAYNRWLYERISNNIPYNQFVSELLLSKGSNFRDPGVNFYRAFLKRTPENIYKNISLLFLGSRTELDSGQVCFRQIRYKKTKEWKEEIVYVDVHTTSTSMDVPMFDGRVITLHANEDTRIPFVAWLTGKENERFSAVMANRVWFWMMGKGIVHEPDDWGVHNQPAYPELMSLLTQCFINSKYDVKSLMRLILTSKAFQSEPQPVGLFVAQRMPAEVLVDALADLTGIPESYRSRVPEPFSFFPEGTRSIDLGDATVSSSMLELFGRVSRDVSYESQRSNKITSRQLLYLMNSVELEDKIRKSEKLNQIALQCTDVESVCKAIVLMTLSRYPTQNEIQLVQAYAQENKLSLRDVTTDVFWTCINSTEFLLNH